MFIQVIQGKVADSARLEECMRRWEAELMPGAIGFVGSTSGISDDGTCILLARFESREAAEANSARPEQGAWWADTVTCFDGEPTFMDCDNVFQWMGGGSDDAHFVQIIEGHTSDASRLSQIWDQAGTRIHELRPEILGGTFMQYGDDGFIEAVYFTNEADARAGEKMEIPDDLRQLMEEDQRLSGDMSYFDLHAPVLMTARR